MRLRNIFKKYLISVLIGIYIAAVLWITLLSRVGEGYRDFLLPFSSYIELFKGNLRSLEEIIENIILFIPFGMIIGVVKKWEWKKVVVIGLCASLVIELSQVLFALGTFEFDDLIHNTLGTVVGYWVIGKIGYRTEIKISQLKVLFIVLFIFVISPIAFQSVYYQHMVKLAALYNRDDGAENLLVLKGDNGYAWNTNVYVSYLHDGSISIKGTSDKQSWWPIGNIRLKPGTYIFSGLSGVKKNTVGLVLETDNHRIIDDVGPVENVEFTLEETTPIKAYVVVYDGCDCDVIATPVIYREG